MKNKKGIYIVASIIFCFVLILSNSERISAQAMTPAELQAHIKELTESAENNQGNYTGLTVPSVYVDNIQLSSTNLNSEEKVSGTFSVTNRESFFISDINFHIQIIEKNNGVPINLIDEKEYPEGFSLAPGEERTINFDYVAPFFSGKAFLGVAIYEKSGTLISSNDREVELKSSREVVKLINPSMINKNGERMLAGGGILYDLGENPQAQFSITNPNQNALSGVLQINIYRRDKSLEMLDSYSGDEINIAPRETQEKNIALHQMKNPGVFLAEVYLKDAGGAIISNRNFFRWIIPGINADILSVTSSRGSCQKDDELNFQVAFVGPAYGGSKAGEANLELTVLNEKDVLVGNMNEKINLDMPEKRNIKFSAGAAASEFKIKARIVKDGTVLSEYITKFFDNNGGKNNSKDESRKPVIALKDKFFEKTWVYVLVGGLLMLSLVLILIKYRKRNNYTSILLFLVILPACFFLTDQKANAYVALPYYKLSDISPLELAWFSPWEGQQFKMDGRIIYNGYVSSPGCGNAFGGDNRYQMWLVDSKGKTFLLASKPFDNANHMWGNWFYGDFPVPKGVSPGWGRAYFYAYGQDIADGAYHEIYAWVNVNFIDVPKATVSLSANPSIISKGESATLSWTTTNASSCTAWNSNNDSEWNGSKSNTSSSQIVSPQSNNTYYIKCSDSGNIETPVAQAGITVYQCLGSSPQNASLCPGDGSGLPNNVNKTQIDGDACGLGSNLDVNHKCQYACNDSRAKAAYNCFPPMDGECNNIDHSFCSQPSNDVMCSIGSPINISVDETIDNAPRYKWQCTGFYGGSNSEYCFADKSCSQIETAPN